MTILFAGGDIGGVRALIPVAQQCQSAGLDVKLLAHGAMGGEWRGNADCLTSDGGVLLRAGSIGCLVFSSSVSDPVPLQLARAASQGGIPTIHLLDHWSSYRERMTTDGGPPFQPSFYCVLDERSWQDAERAGISSDTLRIVGQPALSDLPRGRPRRAPTHPPQVIFVGEPVASDQGDDAAAPSYRGYIERDSIAYFAGSLVELRREITLLLLPHPRQNANDMRLAWQAAGRGYPATIITAARGRDLLPDIDGLVGMASMLLYEGWLSGLPILSVQPYRRSALLEVLAGKQNAWIVEKPETMNAALTAWLDAIVRPPGESGDTATERARHADAPRQALLVIQSCLGAHK